MLKECRSHKHLGEFSESNCTMRCDKCREQKRTNTAKWRQKNKDHIKKQGKAWRLENKNNIKEKQKIWRLENRDHLNKWRRANRVLNINKFREYDRRRNPARHLSLKLEVINAYGGPTCVCCGEEDLFSLTIDHINNDGSSHRKELGLKVIYKWLKRNKYPSGFQVLCHNCNHCKHYNHGKLPEWRKNINIRREIHNEIG